MIKQDGSEVSKLCLAVLERDQPFEETEKELAYIAVQDRYGFNELIPIRRPLSPASVRNYFRLSEKDKDKFRANNPHFFMDSDEGGRYYAAVSNAAHITDRNKQWLQIMHAIFLRSKDTRNADKVQARLLQFQEVVSNETENEREYASSWRD